MNTIHHQEDLAQDVKQKENFSTSEITAQINTKYATIVADREKSERSVEPEDNHKLKEVTDKKLIIGRQA